MGDLPKREVTNTVHVHQLLAFVARSFERDDQDGQGLAEYALILGLIAMIAIVALIFIGGSISGALSTVGSTL